MGVWCHIVLNLLNYYFLKSEIALQRLEKSLEGTNSSEFAKKPMNVAKNRYQACVPYDRNRVILAPIIGHVDASYINATVVRVRIQFEFCVLYSLQIYVILLIFLLFCIGWKIIWSLVLHVHVVIDLVELVIMCCNITFCRAISTRTFWRKTQ